MKTKLTLKFKGERNYLQGPDIFDESLRWLEQQHGPQIISKIEFSFHKIARNALDLYDQKQDAMGEHVAECHYSVESEDKHIYLYENGHSVTDRYPYDENLITKNFEVNTSEKRGSLKKMESNKLSFTDIEIWVALTKMLHQKALPEINGKWLFVRGRFPFYSVQREVTERHLKIISNFQNRLTRTELSADGQKVGEIFFSII